MPRHAEAEDEPRGEDAGGHDLRDGEGGVGERGGGDGLHGLHGHRHAVDEAGGRVVDAGEDEGRAQVQVPGERQGEHDGNVGAQARSPMVPFSSDHTDRKDRFSRARTSRDHGLLLVGRRRRGPAVRDRRRHRRRRASRSWPWLISAPCCGAEIYFFVLPRLSILFC
jgi:hypothetical protein